jgi:putative phage-type endonuclease
MKTIDVIPGSPEWHAHRRSGVFNASDAPAMMGCSPYKTRSQLLHEMATGITPEVDQETQRRFDDGHRAEALARPLAEQIIGQYLYPVTGSNGRMSASFDGLTLDDGASWEHKLINDALRAVLPNEGVGSSDVGASLPLHYRVQIEHQCMVSGAGLALFTASRWADDDGTLIEARHCWYTTEAELRAAIVAGWSQFEADLAAYVPPAAAEPAPVGKAPDTLPALLVQVTGAVTASNLADFKAVALGAIRAVNRTLSTDQDFADAEKAVTWCADVEARIDAAKEHALSQTASIDALFKALDDIKTEARAARLDLDKLVKRRKEDVKGEAVEAARVAMANHIATLNAELAPARLSLAPVDFGGAIKGLKTVASMNDKLSVALANGKIAANEQAQLLRGNLGSFKTLAAGYEHLFADLAALVHKPADDFATLVSARIATHQAAELAREADRAAAEARRVAQAAEAQRLKDEQEDARRRTLALEKQAELPQVVAIPMAPVAPEAAPVDLSGPAPAQPEPSEPATIRLGEICRHLGVTMTAEFVATTLGIPHRATDKAAKLYTATDAKRIAMALAQHAMRKAEENITA